MYRHCFNGDTTWGWDRDENLHKKMPGWKWAILSGNHYRGCSCYPSRLTLNAESGFMNEQVWGFSRQPSKWGSIWLSRKSPFYRYYKTAGDRSNLEDYALSLAVDLHRCNQSLQPTPCIPGRGEKKSPLIIKNTKGKLLTPPWIFVKSATGALLSEWDFMCHLKSIVFLIHMNTASAILFIFQQGSYPICVH